MRGSFYCWLLQAFYYAKRNHPPQLNCYSLSSLLKCTLPRPPSHSLLLLNSPRSSRWHHNSLCWGYCSLSFVTAPGPSAFCCSPWGVQQFVMNKNFFLIHAFTLTLNEVSNTSHTLSRHCLHTNNQTSEGCTTDQTQASASVIIGSSVVRVIYLTQAGHWKGK